ncbi:GH3 auxin-responsive promoter family protein, partial [Chloroflexota bacterium]
MLLEDKYFKELSKAELWQRYCGFLDLSVDEFMKIQKNLLMDQMERISDSILAKKIMKNHKPKSVDEFRELVPLTSYEDYEPYLSEKREDVLAIKPRFWSHSAGRGGSFKWIPHGTEYIEKVIKHTIGIYILGSCKQKGQLNIAPGLRFLSILPPAPYGSGSLFQIVPEYFSIRIYPPTEDTQDMDFQERIKMGFQMALKDGVDVIGTIASVLVRMGEEFTNQMQNASFSPSMLHPKVLLRLIRAWLRSKKEGRGILPKDIWPTKGIMASGMDVAIYKDEIARYWGSLPYEAYGCTEAYFLAIESWNRKGMIFHPDNVFLEFIPYDEKP